jgi:hypothetical protein
MHPGVIRLGLFLLDLNAIPEGLAAAWTFRCCGLRRKHPLAERVQPAVELLAHSPLVLQCGRGLLCLQFLSFRLFDLGKKL